LNYLINDKNNTRECIQPLSSTMTLSW